MALAKETHAADVVGIIEKNGSDRTRLIDIVRETQDTFGCVSEDAIDSIASKMGIHRVEVEGVVSFYHFLTKSRPGSTTIYLTHGAVPSITGVDKIAKAFEDAVGSKFGESSGEDPIGLEWTSCIGMSDQEPAALVDGIVFTNLTPEKVTKLVSHLKDGRDPSELVTETGDGNNSDELVGAMVNNNIRRKGEVIFAERTVGDAVKKLVTMDRADVLGEIKKSNLLGRGGAGFPTWLKWDFCLKCDCEPRYVICNADEGEPGTFKDRVILTERPELVFEGMVVAGYFLFAKEGIIYLRDEYEYLRPLLEDRLNKMREANLLGNNIAGLEGFNFDIRIQMGAGAYICGEETALIESAEGKRGVPRDRPPFPVTYGYEGLPTSVNNVETLACAARIIEKNGTWFNSMGSTKSTGTKVLSVSGDCSNPGVYEVQFGISIEELLSEVGAEDAMAVQVGGPSGRCVPRSEFGRKILFEDLATGGSIIVIGPDRDLLEVVKNFMEFFVEESCGRCTPCRVGNKLLLNALEKIMNGRGTKADIDYIRQLGRTVIMMSRCGLGQTSPNPILTTMEGFPEVYESKLTGEEFVSPHDIEKSIEEGRRAANR